MAEAREVVLELVEKLRPACERIEVAGSIRRGKAEVKDAEMVCIPKEPSPPTPLPQGEGSKEESGSVWALNEPVGVHRTTLLGALDEMVDGGIIEKARYGEKGTQRWGEKYRGLVFKGLRCELFVADKDNWGYQFWLRTGPGDANRFVMTC